MWKSEQNERTMMSIVGGNVEQRDHEACIRKSKQLRSGPSQAIFGYWDDNEHT